MFSLIKIIHELEGGAVQIFILVKGIDMETKRLSEKFMQIHHNRTLKFYFLKRFIFTKFSFTETMTRL